MCPEFEFSERIFYEVRAPFFIIQFNLPGTLDSLCYNDYIRLGMLLGIASEHQECIFTVLQSSGKFFSNGDNFTLNSVQSLTRNEGINEHINGNGNEVGAAENLLKEHTRLQLESFMSSNRFVNESFTTHRKILIACLNGPVIGLSASIILLCDLVYCLDIDNLYMQLVCTTSKTYQSGVSNDQSSVSSLKWEDSSGIEPIERLLCGERITGRDLCNTVRHTLREVDTTVRKIESADIRNSRSETDTTVAEFNESILSDLREKCNYICLPSILKMKRMITECQGPTDRPWLSNSKEVHSFLSLWVEGEPQKRFKVLREKGK